MWTIQYTEPVVRNDIPALDNTVYQIIKSAIENKLRRDPIAFGKPLRSNRKGQRSLRVGDWRVIYMLDQENRHILVEKIGHRREVYED